MNTLRQFAGLAALVLVGGILGAAIYESVVLVPNMRNDIPNSLEHFRLFMRQANPGNFFRAWAPATQVVLLLCVVSSWKVRSARWWYVAALLAMVAGDVVTFTFHYPRNHLLFHAPLSQPVPALVAAAQEWGTGNLGRIALVAVGALGAAWGLRAVLLSSAPAKGS